jgi:hypothetical protein
VVPVWSARLGVDSHNARIEVNHISMGANAEINATVRAWLNGADPKNPNSPLAVPLGLAQRAAFKNTPPVSERNAYVSSTVQGGLSKGAGLNRNAIIKIELVPRTPPLSTARTTSSSAPASPKSASSRRRSLV